MVTDRKSFAAFDLRGIYGYLTSCEESFPNALRVPLCVVGFRRKKAGNVADFRAIRTRGRNRPISPRRGGTLWTTKHGNNLTVEQNGSDKRDK